MPDRLFQFQSFISYWLDAVDEHSLHSPFFFDLYTRVVKPCHTPNNDIERLRKKLLRDKRIIAVKDFGTGSKRPAMRRVSSIARRSLSPARYSLLYSRLIEYVNASTILELGASLGINTLYLALNRKRKVVTFEGAPEIAATAKLTFEFANANNIVLIGGNIAQSLPAYLQTVRKVDFVFMDADHRYESTVSYFHCLLPKIHARSVIVMDDIYYSREMKKAWEYIRRHEMVYASADLFRCGMVFFDPSLYKQHVILQF